MDSRERGGKKAASGSQISCRGGGSPRQHIQIEIASMIKSAFLKPADGVPSSIYHGLKYSSTFTLGCDYNTACSQSDKQTNMSSRGEFRPGMRRLLSLSVVTEHNQ